jgi:hypothetical protein
MVADVSIVYQVRGLGRVHVSDNGAELSNGTEVATRDRRGRWKLAPELGGTEACRLLDTLQEHDRVQGRGDRAFTDELSSKLGTMLGLRGGK